MLDFKWHLQITDEHEDIINNWRINIIKYSRQTIGNYIYITNNGSGYGKNFTHGEPFHSKKISINEFKKYVLNMQIDIILEPNNYLTIFLNKLDIK